MLRHLSKYKDFTDPDEWCLGVRVEHSLSRVLWVLSSPQLP